MERAQENQRLHKNQQLNEPSGNTFNNNKDQLADIQSHNKDRIAQRTISCRGDGPLPNLDENHNYGQLSTRRNTPISDTMVSREQNLDYADRNDQQQRSSNSTNRERLLEWLRLSQAKRDENNRQVFTRWIDRYEAATRLAVEQTPVGTTVTVSGTTPQILTSPTGTHVIGGMTPASVTGTQTLFLPTQLMPSIMPHPACASSGITPGLVIENALSNLNLSFNGCPTMIGVADQTKMVPMVLPTTNPTLEPLQIQRPGNQIDANLLDSHLLSSTHQTGAGTLNEPKGDAQKSPSIDVTALDTSPPEQQLAGDLQTAIGMDGSSDLTSTVTGKSKINQQSQEKAALLECPNLSASWTNNQTHAQQLISGTSSLIAQQIKDPSQLPPGVSPSLLSSQLTMPQQPVPPTMSSGIPSNCNYPFVYNSGATAAPATSPYIHNTSTPQTQLCMPHHSFGSLETQQQTAYQTQQPFYYAYLPNYAQPGYNPTPPHQHTQNPYGLSHPTYQGIPNPVTAPICLNGLTNTGPNTRKTSYDYVNQQVATTLPLNGQFGYTSSGSLPQTAGITGTNSGTGPINYHAYMQGVAHQSMAPNLSSLAPTPSNYQPLSPGLMNSPSIASQYPVLTQTQSTLSTQQAMSSSGSTFQHNTGLLSQSISTPATTAPVTGYPTPGQTPQALHSNSLVHQPNYQSYYYQQLMSASLNSTQFGGGNFVAPLQNYYPVQTGPIINNEISSCPGSEASSEYARIHANNTTTSSNSTSTTGTIIGISDDLLSLETASPSSGNTPSQNWCVGPNSTELVSCTKVVVDAASSEENLDSGAIAEAGAGGDCEVPACQIAATPSGDTKCLLPSDTAEVASETITNNRTGKTSNGLAREGIEKISHQVDAKNDSNATNSGRRASKGANV